MLRNNKQMILGLVMTLGGFIGLIAKAIESVVYRLQNPDFTEYRVFLENPQLTIWGLVFAFICMGGYELMKRSV